MANIPQWVEDVRHLDSGVVDALAELAAAIVSGEDVAAPLGSFNIAVAQALSGAAPQVEDEGTEFGEEDGADPFAEESVEAEEDDTFAEVTRPRRGGKPNPLDEFGEEEENFGEEEPSDEGEDYTDAPAPTRGRGRPARVVAPEPEEEEAPRRGRGRPRAVEPEEEEEAPRRGRGRPARIVEPEPEEEEEAPRRGRGRPPKDDHFETGRAARPTARVAAKPVARTAAPAPRGRTAAPAPRGR